ncbi:hypothetical protein B0H17DRAFT_1332832, partial [Mycena rosella]
GRRHQIRCRPISGSPLSCRFHRLQQPPLHLRTSLHRGLSQALPLLLQLNPLRQRLARRPPQLPRQLLSEIRHPVHQLPRPRPPPYDSLRSWYYLIGVQFDYNALHSIIDFHSQISL